MSAAGLLRVLTYHRVGRAEETPELSPRLISATPEVFERQMRHLARRYAVLAVGEVLEALRGDGRLPPRALLITFDDAYRDFVDHAWPVLTALKLPAVMFVPTGFPDRPERAFRADRLHRAFGGTRRSEIEVEGLGRLRLATADSRRLAARQVQRRLKSLPHGEAEQVLDDLCASLDPSSASPVPSVLGWDELRRLAAGGLALGAHSRTHPLLTRVPLERARAEIRDSLADLRREIGELPPVFCYPNGSHDERVVAAAREEGVALAFTTLDGHNRIGRDDPLRLRRTNVTPRTSPTLFRFRLQRWAPWIDAWRHRVRG
jgi:peptidoglycan/xylan/chitin deacetylase (PgdA/CDA1 family)